MTDFGKINRVALGRIDGREGILACMRCGKAFDAAHGFMVELSRKSHGGDTEYFYIRTCSTRCAGKVKKELEKGASPWDIVGVAPTFSMLGEAFSKLGPRHFAETLNKLRGDRDEPPNYIY